METYVADFETITDKKDCRVWAYAICEVGKDDVLIGNNIDDFMEWCADKRKNYKVLFHNLRFDSQFILAWLFKNKFKHTTDQKDRKAQTFNTLISDKGLYYQIEVIFERKGKTINKVVFQDSNKLLTDMSVKKIAETFNLPFKKMELDYDTYRPVGHELTDHEREYITHDVKIIAHAIKFFYDNGLTKMTIGSCAMSEYKSIVKEKNFDRFFPEPYYDHDVRQSYRGGFTYLNPKFAGKTIKEGVVLDFNSVYPSVMYDEILPYGKPISFKGKYEQDDFYPLYIQMIRCQFELKPGKIPTIQIRHGSQYRANEYLTSSNDEEATLCLTSVDLELFLENYDVYNLEYMSGWKFKGTRGLFKAYIEKWYQVKVDAKKNNNPGMYEISKRMLNALYGKFGTLPKVVSKIPGVNDEGVVYYAGEYTRWNGGVYIGMATFITSYARRRIIKAAQRVTDNYNAGKSKIQFVYADTDSLALISEGQKLPECFKYDDLALGKFKFERKFKRAKFLRQKCYIMDASKPTENDYNLRVTVAGMPEGCYKYVNFRNFKIGATYKGKLEPENVPGGVVLSEVDFTIKRV